MRVRMIFSTRYCGLVPWMLCASFTVRLAMAAAAQPRSPLRALPAQPRSREGRTAFRFRLLRGRPAQTWRGRASARPVRAPPGAGLRARFGAKFHRGTGGTR